MYKSAIMTQVIAMVLIAASEQNAMAQTRTSEQLAAEWRTAKQRELTMQRNVIDAQIDALDDADATPAPRPPDVPPVRFTAASEPTPSATATGTPNDATKTQPKIDNPPPTAEAIAKAIKTLDKKPGGTFGGIDFGGGISFTLDVGTSDRITDAALVNGIVRVNDENNGRARIMLESHYFFTPRGNIDWLGLRNDRDESQWGWGPFIALQPGTDDVIEAVGMGMMFGARRGTGDESFNLGFGIVVDPNTRILGEGLSPNKPLPAGETAIRYKEEMQTGILILSSFSF